MYTTYPLLPASFDTIGFILISLFACVVILLFVAGFCLTETDINVKFVSGIVFAVVSVVFFFFYSDYKEKPIPKNEIVCGNRLGFDSDMTGGKTKHLAGYVQYEMCDGSGIVTLRVDEKRSYPAKLDFYKN